MRRRLVFRMSHRIPCATASRPISCNTEPTHDRCRRCLVTATFLPRKSTHTSPSDSCARLTTTITRVHAPPPRAARQKNDSYLHLPGGRDLMFLLRQPSDEDVSQFIASQQDLPFSYSQVGATKTEPPAGYTVDHNRTRLGDG